MSKNAEITNVKIVLIGESGVGKTCIVSRFVSDMFNANEPSTNGASYAAKTIFFEEHNVNLQMQLWDTAGQERFRSIARMFYKDATAAILVYDITRKASYDEMTKYWYKELLDNAPDDVIIGIAANKADLYAQEQVSETEAREFAQKIGAIFRNTSAMTAGGIEELFIGIGKKLLDPNYKDDAIVSDDGVPEPKPIGSSVLSNQRDTIKLDKNNNKQVKKKKKCCGGGKEGEKTKKEEQ